MLTSARKNTSIVAPVELSEDAVASFMKELAKLVEGKPRVVLIDCRQLENVGSSHVTLLWRARETCEEAGVSMLLSSPTQNLVRILKLLDLVEFFTYEDAGYPELFSDTVRPTTSGVSEGLDRFLRYLVTAQVSERITFELRTVYYEVMTNIRTHSESPRENDIVVTARVTDDEVELVFLDSGPAFNPTDHISDFNPHEAGMRRQTRGFGITMISRLATKMTYDRREDNLNVLTVLKQR